MQEAGGHRHRAAVREVCAQREPGLAPGASAAAAAAAPRADPVGACSSGLPLRAALGRPRLLSCASLLTRPRHPRRRRQVRHLRQLRAPGSSGARVRRVQLWRQRGALRHLRRHRHQRRLLLQGVHNTGERRACGGGPASKARANKRLTRGAERWLPQDCEPGERQDGPILRAQEVRLQKEMSATRRSRWKGGVWCCCRRTLAACTRSVDGLALSRRLARSGGARAGPDWVLADATAASSAQAPVSSEGCPALQSLLLVHLLCAWTSRLLRARRRVADSELDQI